MAMTTEEITQRVNAAFPGGGDDFSRALAALTIQLDVTQAGAKVGKAQQDLAAAQREYQTKKDEADALLGSA